MLRNKRFSFAFWLPKSLKMRLPNKRKGFLRIVPRVEIWGPFVFFLRGTNRGCGEEERTLHGPPEAASIYQEADFSFPSFSSLLNISWSSSLIISRGRFYISIIFIFVKYIIILKPQHIKRKIFNFLSLLNISTSSSLNIR